MTTAKRKPSAVTIGAASLYEDVYQEVCRVIKNASNDDEANSWIADERLEFETRIKIMTDSIERSRADVKKYQDKVKAYHKMRAKPTEQALFEEFCKRAMEAGYQICFANYQFVRRLLLQPTGYQPVRKMPSRIPGEHFRIYLIYCDLQKQSDIR